ncbi:MAG: hypothetical protein ACRD5B_17335, partial [Nitrososphaeraceae archaeon]
MVVVMMVISTLSFVVFTILTHLRKIIAQLRIMLLVHSQICLSPSLQKMISYRRAYNNSHQTTHRMKKRTLAVKMIMV